MPKRTAHSYVSWRDGRPRFQPDQLLRAAGHKGKDLRHVDADGSPGRWFSRGEAVDWSDAFVKQLAANKAATAARRPAGAPAQGQPRSGGSARERLYTVERLFEEWFRSPKFEQPANPHELARLRAEGIVYSPKTIRDYRQKARVIAAHDPSLWAAAVDALSQQVMLGLYEQLVAARGRATAHGTILVLSSAFGWGRRRGKFSFRSNGGINPALDLGMRQAPARNRFGSRTEISTLVAVADRLGWHEMGDMISLGVWTGQRQEDRLLMVDKGLFNGRRIFRQIKTGAVVAVREAPELEARLAAATERRRVARAEALLKAESPAARAAVEARFARVILDEQEAVSAANGERRAAWLPFPDDGDRYRKRFAELRAKAASTCPSLLGGEGVLPFYESDCRSTAVTWMALSGATIPEIIAVTGHTAASATHILKHYLVLHPEMADSAIGKMVAWYEADGETEFGL